MILADSGFFIALLSSKDQLHARANAWSLAIEEPILVTEYVFLECMNFFSRPVDRPKAWLLSDQLMNATSAAWIPATPVLLDKGLNLHRSRPDKDWSLTDCISFSVMGDKGITRALAYAPEF